MAFNPAAVRRLIEFAAVRLRISMNTAFPTLGLRAIGLSWSKMRSMPTRRTNRGYESLLLRGGSRASISVIQMREVRECRQPAGDGHETATVRAGYRSVRPTQRADIRVTRPRRQITWALLTLPAAKVDIRVKKHLAAFFEVAPRATENSPKVFTDKHLLPLWTFAPP